MTQVSKASFVALLCVVAAGCGGSTTSVSGKVTYNGEPVEQGFVSFRPADGMGQVFSASIVDGEYDAPDAVPGSRVVSIHGTKAVKVALSSEESAKIAAERAAAGQGGLHMTEAADYIPDDAEGNNQTHEISTGEQTLNFDLKGPPRK
jgi:hypothetical protein